MTSNQFLPQEEKEYLNRIDELKKANGEQQKDIERLLSIINRMDSYIGKPEDDIGELKAEIERLRKENADLKDGIYSYDIPGKHIQGKYISIDTRDAEIEPLRRELPQIII